MSIIKETIESNGIIIRVTPYGDSDLILTALLQEGGKRSFLARSAKKSSKRFGGTMEIFERGLFHYSKGKGALFSLVSFSNAKSLLQLRNNLVCLSAASVLCESFDQLLLEDAYDSFDYYQLLTESLNAIALGPDSISTLRACYFGLQELLNTCGYLDVEAAAPPSFKRLIYLTTLVERSSERPLRSLDSLRMIEAQLRE